MSSGRQDGQFSTRQRLSSPTDLPPYEPSQTAALLSQIQRPRGIRSFLPQWTRPVAWAIDVARDASTPTYAHTKGHRFASRALIRHIHRAAYSPQSKTIIRFLMENSEAVRHLVAALKRLGPSYDLRSQLSAHPRKLYVARIEIPTAHADPHYLTAHLDHLLEKAVQEKKFHPLSYYVKSPLNPTLRSAVLVGPPHEGHVVVFLVVLSTWYREKLQEIRLLSEVRQDLGQSQREQPAS